MIPHEPLPDQLHVGKFFIALSRGGTGFVQACAKKTILCTTSVRKAARFDGRLEWSNFVTANRLDARDFKLLACTEEVRVGPKPAPPSTEPAPKKKGKKKDAVQAALNV